ncbi:hypothetical protein A3L09_00260 [Thermococcus profundus]|uniref:Uncharacterized protein n=1 Tax=Thermococcus profundus TaxID=49899 RepID=A0A2Z2MH75_THEPR|nr:hypothetical protein [Thermococcus profundus]ASJ01801.1 hypothetical protein A3L09_00260 [Thermococcus profundus]
MSRGSVVLLVSLLLVVLVAGCMGGGNFVYSKGKMIGPHKELRYSFRGSVDLEVKVSGSGPFTLLIASPDGSREIFEKENVTEVKETVKLPEGSWNVVIRNEGNSPIKLDISLRGK